MQRNLIGSSGPAFSVFAIPISCFVAHAGVLGDNVKISKDKSKITVVTETSFSKRCDTAVFDFLI